MDDKKKKKNEKYSAEAYMKVFQKQLQRKDTPLHKACKDGNVVGVEKILKDIDITELTIQDKAKCHTPLFYAVDFKHTTIVKMLLEKDPDLLRKNSKSRNAGLLFKAIENENVEIIQQLLSKGIDVNHQQPRRKEDVKHVPTALHYACCGSEGSVDPDVVRTLLQSGAKVNVKNSDLETPLLLVLALDYYSSDEINGVADLLLEHGAEVLCKGKNKKSPLYLAVENKREKISQKLLEIHGTPIIDQDLDEGRTLLRAAVVSGSTATVSLLLDRGADPSQTHPILGSLLQAASKIKSLSVANKMLDLLLKRGAQSTVNFMTTHKIGQYHMSVLREFAIKGNYSAVKTLLANGARADIGHALHWEGEEMKFLWGPGHGPGGTIGAEYNFDIYKSLKITKLLVAHGAYLDVAILSGVVVIYDYMSRPRLGGAPMLKHLLKQNAIQPPAKKCQRLHCGDLNKNYEEMYRFTGDLDVLKVFAQSGFTFKEIESIVDDELDIEELSDDIKSLVREVKKVQSLKSLCRIAIRSEMGCPMSKLVGKLGLPEMMNEYLMYSEIEESDDEDDENDEDDEDEIDSEDGGDENGDNDDANNGCKTQ